MYIKKLNLVICLVLALVVGFGSSYLIKNNSVGSDQLSGDISKASIYNNAQMEDPEASIIEEQLKNDTTYRQVTQFTMDLLKERVGLVSDLTQKTMDICSDIPEISEMLPALNSLKAKAHNTNLAIDAACKGIEKVNSGISAPEYETAANNTLIGYQKIESQMQLSKRFVDAAAKYIENGGEKSEQMAELIADWTEYNVQNALLNNSKEEMEYWNDKIDHINGILSNTDNKVMLNLRKIEVLDAIDHNVMLNAIQSLMIFDNCPISGAIFIGQNSSKAILSDKMNNESLLRGRIIRIMDNAGASEVISEHLVKEIISAVNKYPAALDAIAGPEALFSNNQSMALDNIVKTTMLKSTILNTALSNAGGQNHGLE